MVHALNVALFFVSLAAFEFFWSGLMEVRKLADEGHTTGGMPETVLWSLGYPFFIWLSVGSLVSMINPDLVVMTLVLLVAGLRHVFTEVATVSGIYISSWACFSELPI